MQKIILHTRLAAENAPAGITVSRHEKLPTGDFTISEYSWDDITLWFVDADRFTADERQAVYESYVRSMVRGPKIEGP